MQTAALAQDTVKGLQDQKTFLRTQFCVLAQQVGAVCRQSEHESQATTILKTQNPSKEIR